MCERCRSEDGGGSPASDASSGIDCGHATRAGARASRPEPERVCSWLALPLLILFGCHSTEIDPYVNRDDPLGWFVEWLEARPGVVERLRRLGYQSVLGPESEVPTTLSQRRAEAVAEALAGRGIAPERIEAIGEGHWIHTAPHYDDCRAIDRQRQVAFHVLLCATAEEAEAARRLH